MLNEFEDQNYIEQPPERPLRWINEDTGEVMSPKDMSWNELAAQQRANRETEAINENRRTFDQYLAIEQGAKRQKSELTHQRAIAFTAAAHSARENGGMSDSSLSASLSQAFGRPTYGIQLVKGIDIGNGPESVYVMYGPGKDPQTGKTTIRPTGMVGSRDAVKLFDSAGLGDDTNDLRNDIIDNSYLGKLTDNQRAILGVSRPSAPISTGTTVISGAAMRALRGQGRTRAPVSVFSNVGGDGRIGSGFTSRTIHPDGTVVDNSTGTNSPDWSGWYRMPLAGDGSVQSFKNKFTGEMVDVPKGQTLANVLRGTSEREKVAQINADARMGAAEISAWLRGRGYDIDEKKLEEYRRHNLAKEKNAEGRNAGARGAGGDGSKYDDKIADRLQQRADALREKYGDDPTPEQQKEIDAAQTKADAYVDRYSGSGAEGDAEQGGNNITSAKRDELIRRGMLNPDGTPKVTSGRAPSPSPAGNATNTPPAQQKKGTEPKETYDTKLTPEEEAQYQKWRKTLPEELQYEGDYDLRGYWKDPDTQKDNIEDGQHFTDRYKKPNHPTFSNESMYATGENEGRAGHWDENGEFVASDAQLTERENVRIKEFKKLGGQYTRDADGNVRLRIANWDYLPENLKKRYSEHVEGDLDELMMSVQRKANAAKKAFDEDFNKNVLPGIKADARKKFPDNTTKRDKYVREETQRWRNENDPATSREMREYNSQRGGAYIGVGL